MTPRERHRQIAEQVGQRVSYTAGRWWVSGVLCLAAREPFETGKVTLSCACPPRYLGDPGCFPLTDCPHLDQRWQALPLAEATVKGVIAILQESANRAAPAALGTPRPYTTRDGWSGDIVLAESAGAAIAVQARYVDLALTWTCPDRWTIGGRVRSLGGQWITPLIGYRDGNPVATIANFRIRRAAQARTPAVAHVE